MNERIYVQTNDADTNEVIAYDRSDDGRLDQLGRFETGGRGTGVPHLASQNSIVLSDDGAWLLVTNAGSDELTLFSVESDGLELAATIASGGSAPTSVAVREELVYALNNGGTPNITGFTLAGGGLAPIDGSTRPLSAGNADPAQISFSPDAKTLVVTERGTNAISSYTVDRRGIAEGPETIPCSGATPYGFDFANGSVIVANSPEQARRVRKDLAFGAWPAVRMSQDEAAAPYEAASADTPGAIDATDNPSASATGPAITAL